MRLLKKSMPTWVTVVIVLLVTTVAVAVLQTQYDIASHVGVEGEFGLSVLDFPDKLIEITFFEFGNVPVGQSNTTEMFVVKNIGNVETWIAWTVINLPPDFSITLRDLDSGLYIPMDDYTTLPSVQPNSFWGGDLNGRFEITLTNNATSAGDYTFTIRFLGADSSAG